MSQRRLDAAGAGLATPIGQRGSGKARYAAAMYFYTQGLMPPEMLEIYRRCSTLDAEDPVDLARFEGIAVPDIARTVTCTAAPKPAA